MDNEELREHLIKRKAELKKISCDLADVHDWFEKNNIEIQVGLCSAIAEIDDAGDYVQDAIDELTGRSR